MQVFHDQLFDETAKEDSLLSRLSDLAGSSLEQLSILKSDLAWDPWDAEADPAE